MAGRDIAPMPPSGWVWLRVRLRDGAARCGTRRLVVLGRLRGVPTPGAARRRSETWAGDGWRDRYGKRRRSSTDGEGSTNDVANRHVAFLSTRGPVAHECETRPRAPLVAIGRPVECRDDSLSLPGEGILIRSARIGTTTQTLEATRKVTDPGES